MANKLTRYLQKIFANNSNQVGVFGTGTDKVTSKNVETLQPSDYEDGWSAAIVTSKNYPIWQERDGVDYGFSYQLAYLMQNGMPEWLATETYYTNSFCKAGSGIYVSLTDNNINNNPTTDTVNWQLFADYKNWVQPVTTMDVKGLRMGISSDTSVLVKSGYTYDSTYSKVIYSATDITKTIPSIAASTYYNVFVIANDDNSSVDIAFSTTSTPTLPTGYTVYKYIGQLWTDNSAKIRWVNDIYSASYAENALPSLTYTALTYTNGGQYIAPANGYFVVQCTYKEGGVSMRYLNISGGLNVGANTWNNSNTQITGYCTLPARAGRTITVTSYGSPTINQFGFVYANGSVPIT